MELGAKSVFTGVALAVVGGILLAGAAFSTIRQRLVADHAPAYVLTDADFALIAQQNFAVSASWSSEAFFGGDKSQPGSTFVSSDLADDVWGEQAAGNRFHGDDVPIAPVAPEKFAGSSLPEPPALTAGRPGQAAAPFAKGRAIAARLGPERELVVLSLP